MSRPERSSGRLSSKVTTSLSDSSCICCWNAATVPRPGGFALSARAFHRATCLATLAIELPPCVRVQASTPVHSEPLVDMLVQVCLAGSYLFGTVVLRIFLCRVRLKTVWILLASADPSPAVVLGRCLLPDRELRLVDLQLSRPSEHCIPRAFTWRG